MGYIHSDLSNRLGVQKFEKLTFAIRKKARLLRDRFFVSLTLSGPLFVQCTFTRSTQYLTLNASKVSNLKYKAIPEQKGPQFRFFRHSETSFFSSVRFFPMSPKGARSFFFRNFATERILKKLKGPLLHFSTLRLFKIDCLVLGFLNGYRPIIFSMLSEFST